MSTDANDRSYLFVPANDSVRVPKAVDGPADAVILDLEDSVAELEKSSVRARLDPSLLSSERRLWVRINGMATDHCFADVEAAVGNGARRLVVPKVESAQDVHSLDWVLLQLERKAGVRTGAVELICIIESARGLAHVDAIAAASPRISRLMYGGVDLAADMKADFGSDGGPTAQARFAIARASRLAGLAGPIDTAFIHTSDVDQLRLSTSSAKSFGFTGKVCIHPKQVAVVNEVFSPSSDQIALARMIVSAFDQAVSAGKAAVLVDGTMVDYPVATRARQLLTSVDRNGY